MIARPSSLTTALLAVLATIILVAFGATVGSRITTNKVHALCESGETFYRLSGDGDTPYRCTRVIDYPPTTGATE